MKERSTLARPYASAVFKIAQQDDKLSLWSEMLHFTAQVMADPAIDKLVDDPRVEPARLGELIIEVASGRFTDKAQNLIRVLAENKRLALVNEIFELYELARAEAEKREVVEVISAYEVNPKFQQNIATAMAKKLGRDVELKTRIDKDLIGGVMIRAGDLVIDASLKGRLEKMITSLV